MFRLTHPITTHTASQRSRYATPSQETTTQHNTTQHNTTQLSTAKRDETTMGIFSLLPVTRTRMEAAPVSQVGGPPTKRVSETFEQKLYRKVSSTREYKPKTLDERQMKDVFLSLVVVVVVSLLSHLVAASIYVANNVCVCMLSTTQRLYFVPLVSSRRSSRESRWSPSVVW